jgi:hypothetical protein
MKKLVGLIVLILFLTMSFVLADISISEPLDVYNLGDRLYVSVNGLVETENGNFNINLVCGNKTIVLVKIPARAFSEQEELDYSIPYKIINYEDLELNNLSEIVGDCQVVASVGSSVASTKTFRISDDISVSANTNKASYDPGEAISVNIEAIKDNGFKLNGFIEGSNATSFNKAIEDGTTSNVFTLPETSEAGIYTLTIRAYDTGRNGVLNEGSADISFRINQVASSMILSLSDVSATPDEEFSVGAEVYDQSGIKMNGVVALEFVSPEGEIIDSTIPNDGFASISFPSNSTPGIWTVIASFNSLSDAREFEMATVQKVDFQIEDSVLTVTNVGNTLYNKTIDVQVGEEQIMTLDLRINVGESRKFKIDAPNGEYDVKIDDGDNSLTATTLLTGNAIKISDLKEVGFFKGYSIIWIFFILIFGGIGTVLFMRYRKTKTLSEKGFLKGFGDKSGAIMKNVSGGLGKMKGKMSSKIPKKIRSQVNDTLNFTNKSPSVQGLDQDGYSHEDNTLLDFSKKDAMSAESTLVLKGEKYISAVVAIGVKDYDKMSDVAKDALKKAIGNTQNSKGLVDWRGDYIFIVFSPIVTKTYKNEVLAAKEAMAILGILNNYNKKFKDKIKFNIGVHVGELVASKEGNKLKYTSIGNTISLAKRIADSDGGKLIVSDDIRKKLLRDLKVVKAKEVGGNQTYEVGEIKDRAADAARLKDLLKRNY